MIKKTILAIAALSIAGLSLAGCNTTSGTSTTTTVTTVLNDALAYACPIAATIQVSTLKLSAADEAIVNTAVTDCNIWSANPSATFSNPETVATTLVQAAVVLENSGAFKALPAEKKASFKHGVAKLKAALRS